MYGPDVNWYCIQTKSDPDSVPTKLWKYCECEIGEWFFPYLRMETMEGSIKKYRSVPNQMDGTVEEYEDGQLLCDFFLSKV